MGGGGRERSFSETGGGGRNGEEGGEGRRVVEEEEEEDDDDGGYDRTIPSLLAGVVMSLLRSIVDGGGGPAGAGAGGGSNPNPLLLPRLLLATFSLLDSLFSLLPSPPNFFPPSFSLPPAAAPPPAPAPPAPAPAPAPPLFTSGARDALIGASWYVLSTYDPWGFPQDTNASSAAAAAAAAADDERDRTELGILSSREGRQIVERVLVRTYEEG